MLIVTTYSLWEAASFFITLENISHTTKQHHPEDWNLDPQNLEVSGFKIIYLRNKVSYFSYSVMHKVWLH